MNSKKVSIVILNWNGWKDTLECLDSVLSIDYPNYGVIVVDNGSTDNSVQMIKDWWKGDSKGFVGNANRKRLDFFEVDEKEVACIINGEKPQAIMSRDIRELTLIKNRKNYGFALGNNNAIRYALNVFEPDYVLLLNNDTVADRAFLTNLVDVIDNDDNIGIIGPVNYSYSAPTKIIAVGENIDWKRGKTVISRSLPDQLPETACLEFDEVPGSCLLFRTKMVDDIGLMDSAYFCYYEETDWCIRAKRHGWKICCTQHSKIFHKYGSTEKKVHGFKLYYLTRNRFWFMRKWASNLGFLIFLFFFLEDFALTTVDLLLLRMDAGLMRVYLTAIYDGLR